MHTPQYVTNHLCVYEIHVHSYIKIEVQCNFFNNLYHVLLDLRIYFFQRDKTQAHFQMGLAALGDAWHRSLLGQRKMFQSILFLYPNQPVTQSIIFTILKQYKEMMKREKNPSLIITYTIPQTQQKLRKTIHVRCILVQNNWNSAYISIYINVERKVLPQHLSLCQ